MPWVRLDEQFPEHPKIVMAGPLAGWLHVCGLAYCNRMMTDGFIPRAQVGKLADWSGVFVDTGQVMAIDHPDSADLAAQLVELGVWDEARGGYAIHDYLEYQPSKAEVEAQRKVKAAAGKKGADSRWGSRPKAPGQQPNDIPDGKPIADAMADPIANGLAKRWPDPDTDPHTSTSAVTPTGPPPTVADDDRRNGNGLAPWAELDQADRAVLENLTRRLGWTAAGLQKNLLTEWRFGLRHLDRRYLEDALLATADHHPRSAKYLHTAILAACEKAGIDPEDHRVNRAKLLGAAGQPR